MAIFEGFSDEHGCAMLGWLDDRVLYSRWEHEISANLGRRVVERFVSLIGAQTGVRYFADSSAVTSYDLHAMAALVNALIATKGQFQLIVALPWQGAIGQAAAKFAAGMECVEYVRDAAEFVVRLRAAAPNFNHSALRRTRERSVSTTPESTQHAYTYVFDLRQFEEGIFTATRQEHSAMAPPGKWVCVARDDEHALQLARQAARAEWAAPHSRRPEDFTVQFGDVDTVTRPVLQ